MAPFAAAGGCGCGYYCVLAVRRRARLLVTLERRHQEGAHRLFLAGHPPDVGPHSPTALARVSPHARWYLRCLAIAGVLLS